MRTLILTVISILFWPVAILATDIIAITDVRILTFSEQGTIENGQILIENNRITHVGQSGTFEIPEKAAILSYPEATVIPGLAEMHGHLPYGNWDRERIKETLFLYLAGGVTTVRGMLGDDIQFALRNEIKQGTLAGPTLYLAAPSLNGNTVNSVQEGRDKLLKYANAGWDLQKIHPGLTRDEYIAIAEEADKAGFPFGGHVPQDAGVLLALQSGQISIDHMDGYMDWLDGDKQDISAKDLQKAASVTREAGTWIVPTQALFNLLRSGGDLDKLMAQPENDYMSQEIITSWQQTVRRLNNTANPLLRINRQRLLKAFADGGVNIALGSDAPQIFSVPGFSIWREIKVMSEAGLTPLQILTAGTLNPGKYFSDKDQFGQIKPGFRADILILDGNPVEDITAITRQHGVMANGRWFSKEIIKQRLDGIKSRHHPDRP